MAALVLDSHQVQSYAALIRHCSGHSVTEARRIHGLISAAGYDQDRFLRNLLIEMYGRCKLLEEALLVFQGIRSPNQFSYNLLLAAFAHNGELLQVQKLFDDLPARDVVSWNLVLTASVQRQHNQEVFGYYRKMRLEGFCCDEITFVTILAACTSVAFLSQGQLVHAQIIDAGLELHVSVATALVHMYGRCLEVDRAVRVFEGMAEKDLVSWTTMVAVFADTGNVQDAWKTFNRMPQRNVVSWTTMLVAYAENGHLERAKYLFDRFPQRDVIAWNAMVTAYVNGGVLDEARSVFDEMVERSKATWNVMLTGYAQGGHALEAWELFRKMDLEGFQPDKISFVCVLESLPGDSAEAGIVHREALETGDISEVSVATALVHMYGKCGNLRRARVVFGEMKNRSLLSWNAMLTAYARNGHVSSMVGFLSEMSNDGVELNAVTFISVLAGFSHRGLLKDGHSNFISIVADYGIMPILDHYICMVDLLGRAGQVEEAKELIENMPFDADSATWTALLSASRIHKNGSNDTAAAAPEKLIECHPQISGPYVLLSNIYESPSKLAARG